MDHAVFQAFQRNQNCYGNLLASYVVPGVAWSSSNGNILGSLGNGDFQAFLPGSANAESNWGACSYYFINYPIMQCQEYCHSVYHGSGVTVDPSVTIQNPTSLRIPLDSSGRTGVTHSISLTAQGSPSGGSYQWTTNSPKVNLSNSTSATVTVNSESASTSEDDVTVIVTYEKDGTSTASVQLTVVKPTSLERGTDQFSSTGHSCQDDGLPCNSYLRTLTYTIKDQFGNTFPYSNFFAHEFFDNWAGCPHTDMHTHDIQGFGTGFTDNFFLCSEDCPGCGSTGQGCDMTANQTWSVNGFDVRNNAVEWTCSDATVTQIP